MWGYDILKIVLFDFFLCGKFIYLNLIYFYLIFIYEYFLLEKFLMFLKFGFSEINRLFVESIYLICYRKKMYNVLLIFLNLIKLYFIIYL